MSYYLFGKSLVTKYVSVEKADDLGVSIVSMIIEEECGGLAPVLSMANRRCDIEQEDELNRTGEISKSYIVSVSTKEKEGEYKMFEGVLDTVGKTPIIRIRDNKNLDIYIKYEGKNPTGSVKDRAASYIISKMLKKNLINKDTEIIESSSGNFGIALSAFCKQAGLKCTIVIDPNILPINEFLLTHFASEVVKVDKRDSTGGFLLTRTGYIKEKLQKNDNIFWINQYANEDVAEAYYSTIAEEICDEVKVDYIFIGVSSGGTITGISKKVKERYPDAKVIAVDVEGSVIFSSMPKRRYLPGIGSSMHPDILNKAKIDDVVIVKEEDSVKTCWEFLKKHSMMIGGSSGSVYCAIHQYFKDKDFDEKKNVVTLFADCGERYASTIYNMEWGKQHFQINL